MSEKLISADELKRILHSFYGNMGAVPYFEDLIDLSSAVDAVEVVRCEKCRYRFNVTYGESKEEVMFCNLEFGLAGIINPDDFCSYGERREENADTDDR